MGNTPNPVLRSAGLSRGTTTQPHTDSAAGGTGTGFNEYMNSLREQMLHPSPWTPPEAIEGAAIAYTFFSYKHQLGNIERALTRSLVYFPAEIEKFGQDTWKGIQAGLIPAVKQAVTIIAATTLAGTLAGALGGLGVLDEITVPAGAAAGLQIGLEIVDAMMLYEALKAALQNIQDIILSTAEASEIAWNAGQRRGHSEVADIEEAAKKYAHAFGALFALVVNIVVAWILKRGAEKIAKLSIGEVFDRAWQKAIEKGSQWSSSIGNWLRSVRDWIKNLFKPKEEGGGTVPQEQNQSSSSGSQSQSTQHGTTPSQPGQWQTVNESMSPRAAAYQSQISGQPPGQAYVVNGVKFDGYDGTNLLDAKGPGYATFVGSDGQFKPWYQGADGLLDQAERQTVAAGNTPIVWHVAEQPAANAMQNLLQQNGFSNITVVHTPPTP